MQYSNAHAEGRVWGEEAVKGGARLGVVAFWTFGEIEG